VKKNAWKGNKPIACKQHFANQRSKYWIASEMKHFPKPILPACFIFSLKSTFFFSRIVNFDGIFVLLQNVQRLSFRTKVSKLRIAGQIRPVKPFDPAREAISSDCKDILSKMKNNILSKNVLIC